jgi:hypothetical protein
MRHTYPTSVRPTCSLTCSQSVYSQSVYSQSVYSQSVYSQSVYSQSVYSQPVGSQSVKARRQSGTHAASPMSRLAGNSPVTRYSSS